MKKTSQVCQNWEISYWTGIPHFTALHFCGLHKYCVVFVCLFFVVLGVFWCFFKKIVHLWPPCIEEVYWCHIPTSFAHFVSRFGNSHNISNLILLFCYGDLWSVIFDVTIVLVLGCYQPCPCKMSNLIGKYCMCADCSAEWPFPCLSFSTGLPIPWDTTILKFDQLVTLPWPLSIQVKWRVLRLSL